MSLTEQTRLRLHRYLEELMDRELANEVMEWLPRGELATRDDIEALRLATKAEIEGLRAEMTAEFASVRTEMAARFEGVGYRFDAVGYRFDAIDTRLGTVATAEAVANLRAEIHNAIRLHTIVLVGALGTMVSIARIF